MRFLIKTFRLFLFVYLIIVAVMYLVQDRFIFHPDMIIKDARSMLVKFDHPKHLTFTTKDGTKLEGVYQENGKKLPLLLYFAGNAENVLHTYEIAQKIKNYNFLAFNYRGYGLSQGEPSEKTLLEDALEIFDKYGDEKTLLVGRSLGTSVATYIASQRKADKLILFTPFDSILALSADVMPFLPHSLILKHTFRSDLFMDAVEEPVSILTASKDTLVTKKHTEALKTHISHLAYEETAEGTHNLDFTIFSAFLKKVTDEKLFKRE